MTATFRLDLKTPAGSKFAEIVDFEWLSCSLRVNSPGLLQTQLRGDKTYLSQLSNDSQVELWWRDPAIAVDWTRFFSGLYRGQNRALEPTSTFQLVAVGDLALLKRRIVNWAANTTDRSKFTSKAAETVMKTLVQYNITADATVVNGRRRDGTYFPGDSITVQSNSAAGNTVDWYCFGDNLLETLQKLEKIAGGDFDLVKTGSKAWEFRWYTGQLGTDRSADVLFAVEQGNMGAPTYQYDRVEEKTVACVWGQGDEATRDYRTVLSTDHSADNDIELYIDARDITLGDTAGLDERGNQKLEEVRAREKFNFQVLQTQSSQFGVHYFLGDLVAVRNPFTGNLRNQKVLAITLGLAQDGKKTLDVELQTP